MNREEIEQAVTQILHKQESGENLTEHEETILAYGYYAAREQRMVFELPEETDESN